MTVVKQDEVEKALMDKIQIIKGLVIERDGKIDKLTQLLPNWGKLFKCSIKGY